MPLIEAYEKKSGRKALIPSDWLSHPRLGRDWSRTPRQKAGESAVTAAKADQATTKTPDAGDDRKEARNGR